MEITIIQENKKQFIDLLLLGDEQESMIDHYLERGDLFALYDDGLKTVCVVTQESDRVCELKNIATCEKWQRNGYGSALLRHIGKHYKDRFTTMMVGTGAVPMILKFYEKNGFSYSRTVKNFFTDNYDHPMFENGIQLVDMIYLSKAL